jgi:LDH2 family malate/lactate/ureidoglycolate dehydrogenase
LPRILAIAREARARNARVLVAVVHETPVSALVDVGNNVGYVAVYRGAEIAIAKAKQSGVARSPSTTAISAGATPITSNASSISDLSVCILVIVHSLSQ